MPIAQTPAIVMTTTGELFLPARVIYRVRNRAHLLERFRRLPDMQWDPGRGRWTWNYGPQARRLGFPAAYEMLPPEQQPLVLASCYLTAAHTLQVYVRCASRLIKLLVFFDQEIPRRCARAQFLDQYNAVTITGPGGVSPAPEDFFRNEAEIEFPDLESRLTNLQTEAQKQELLAWMSEQARRPMPLRARHRLEVFYEEGAQAMEQRQQLRQYLVWRQYKEGKPICPRDVIQELMRGEPPAPP
jgi:hypothetical protein